MALENNIFGSPSLFLSPILHPIPVILTVDARGISLHEVDNDDPIWFLTEEQRGDRLLGRQGKGGGGGRGEGRVEGRCEEKKRRGREEEKEQDEEADGSGV